MSRRTKAEIEGQLLEALRSIEMLLQAYRDLSSSTEAGFFDVTEDPAYKRARKIDKFEETEGLTRELRLLRRMAKYAKRRKRKLTRYRKKAKALNASKEYNVFQMAEILDPLWKDVSEAEAELLLIVEEYENL